MRIRWSLASLAVGWLAGIGCGSSGGSSLQPQVCRDYVACVAIAAPATLAQVQASYGDNGSCWQSPSLVASCTTGCMTGLAMQAAASPSTVECVCPGADPACIKANFYTCPQISACAGACGDDACFAACRAKGTSAAQMKFDALVACEITPCVSSGSCTDPTDARATCLQCENTKSPGCSAERTACTNDS